MEQHFTIFSALNKKKYGALLNSSLFWSSSFFSLFVRFFFFFFLFTFLPSFTLFSIIIQYLLTLQPSPFFLSPFFPLHVSWKTTGYSKYGVAIVQVKATKRADQTESQKSTYRGSS